ncbi:MAG: TlpA family protein disulfide reductase [Candidatus Eremiobacteraeota bacterium]|nr:TlpA family protein disulfide reductase [Candidatus Eremiobacteraeota bacterium]
MSLDRPAFIAGLVAVLAAPSAKPAPSPSPAPSDDGPKICTHNSALPYDRPIGLKMRVLDGPQFSLVEHRGHPVLLVMFATWCAPCNEEMPHIVNIAQSYEAAGLYTVAVNFREKDNPVRDFRKKFGITFPIAMDEDGAFTDVLQGGNGSIGIPSLLLIDKAGYLSCYTAGGLDEATLRDAIAKLL